MKSTIRTEAGCAVITALVGRVDFNGGTMLPHEAHELGLSLQTAANAALANSNAAVGDSLRIARGLYETMGLVGSELTRAARAAA